MAPEYEALFGGAAGGGKSIALVMAACRGLKYPDYRALLIRRTYPELNSPGGLIDISHQFFGRFSDCRWKASDRTWEFPWGSKIVLSHCQHDRDIQKYQGTAWWYVGFDELSHFTEEPYLWIQSRMRKPVLYQHWTPVIRATANPGGVGHGWITQRWGISEKPADVVRTSGNGTDRVFIQSLMTDNPGLDHDEYRRAMSNLPKLQQDQLLNGIWTVDKGMQVLSCFGEDCIEPQWQPPQELRQWTRTVIGIDYGVVDDCAWAVIQWNRFSKQLHIVHTEEQSGLTPSMAAQITRGLIERWKPEQIVGDSGGLGKGFIQEFNKRYGVGLYIKPAQKTDRLGMIALMNGAMDQGLLKISDHLHSAIGQFRDLRWKDATRSDTVGRDHQFDAVLYCWREVRQYVTDTVPAVDRNALEEQAMFQRSVHQMNAQMRHNRTGLGL